MAENITSPTDFKEAVCLDVGRVYDSCCDRDCLEDLRCYFSPRGQEVIEQAISVRCKDAEILNVFIDVEPVHFNRGFYACDLTYFFLVKFDVFTAPHCQPIEVQGVCYFEKKCILFGSEGSVRVFSSEYNCDETDEQVKQSSNTPKCVAEAVDPVALSCKLADCCNCCCEIKCLPACICRQLGSDICAPDCCQRTVLVTLGLFSIIKLVRNVQVLVPVYDFCIPDKECNCSYDNPCETFKRINFPTDEFFPPKESDIDCGIPYSCCKKQQF